MDSSQSGKLAITSYTITHSLEDEIENCKQDNHSMFNSYAYNQVYSNKKLDVPCAIKIPVTLHSSSHLTEILNKSAAATVLLSSLTTKPAICSPRSPSTLELQAALTKKFKSPQTCSSSSNSDNDKLQSQSNITDAAAAVTTKVSVVSPVNRTPFTASKQRIANQKTTVTEEGNGSRPYCKLLFSPAVNEISKETLSRLKDRGDSHPIAPPPFPPHPPPSQNITREKKTTTSSSFSPQTSSSSSVVKKSLAILKTTVTHDIAKENHYTTFSSLLASTSLSSQASHSTSTTTKKQTPPQILPVQPKERGILCERTPEKNNVVNPTLKLSNKYPQKNSDKKSTVLLSPYSQYRSPPKLIAEQRFSSTHQNSPQSQVCPPRRPIEAFEKRGSVRDLRSNLAQQEQGILNKFIARIDSNKNFTHAKAPLPQQQLQTPRSSHPINFLSSRRSAQQVNFVSSNDFSQNGRDNTPSSTSQYACYSQMIHDNSSLAIKREEEELSIQVKHIEAEQRELKAKNDVLEQYKKLLKRKISFKSITPSRLSSAEIPIHPKQQASTNIIPETITVNLTQQSSCQCQTQLKLTSKVNETLSLFQSTPSLMQSNHQPPKQVSFVPSSKQPILSLTTVIGKEKLLPPSTKNINKEQSPGQQNNLPSYLKSRVAISSANLSPLASQRILPVETVHLYPNQTHTISEQIKELFSRKKSQNDQRITPVKITSNSKHNDALRVAREEFIKRNFQRKQSESSIRDQTSTSITQGSPQQPTRLYNSSKCEQQPQYLPRERQQRSHLPPSNLQSPLAQSTQLISSNMNSSSVLDLQENLLDSTIIKRLMTSQKRELQEPEGDIWQQNEQFLAWRRRTEEEQTVEVNMQLQPSSQSHRENETQQQRVQEKQKIQLQLVKEPSLQIKRQNFSLFFEQPTLNINESFAMLQNSAEIMREDSSLFASCIPENTEGELCLQKQQLKQEQQRNFGPTKNNSNLDKLVQKSEKIPKNLQPEKTYQMISLKKRGSLHKFL